MLQERKTSLGSSADCSTSISLVSFPDVGDDSICLRLPSGAGGELEIRQKSSQHVISPWERVVESSLHARVS